MLHKEKEIIQGRYWGTEFYSIPCRTSYFEPKVYEEKDEFTILHQNDMMKRVNSSNSSHCPGAK